LPTNAENSGRNSNQMPLKKGQAPPAGRPFAKGQSGNPGGRPKKDVALEEWRRTNAQALHEVVTPEEIRDTWLRWFSRFRAGSSDALWMVPYLFGPAPKETKQTVEMSGPNGGPIPTTVADYAAGVAAIAGGSAEDS
jgi:hypothetical protein